MDGDPISQVGVEGEAACCGEVDNYLALIKAAFLGC